MPTRLPALLIVAILAACQAPTSQPSEVEVSGIAQAGPVCPVERQPPDPACADRPVAGAIVVVTNNGNEVTRTISAADGTFHLRLAPGEYQLVPQPAQGLMGTAQPIALTVRTGEPMAPLVVTYDTGIR
jgi:hypothetical protein